MPCRGCGNSDDIEFALESRYDGRVLEYYFCPRCELLYHTQEMPPDYYDGAYRREVSGSATVTDKTRADNQARAQALIIPLQTILPVVPPNGKILDVGSSDGTLLRTIASLGDYELYGVEPSTDYAAECNFPVFRSIDEARGMHFDLITCIHTIEHFNDLSVLDTMLEIGDYLLIETPNIITYPTATSYPHTMLFTERSLYNCLAIHNWQPLYILPHWGVFRNMYHPGNLLAMAIHGKPDKYVYTVSNIATNAHFREMRRALD